MPELKIVWRNPNPQLQVGQRRIQKCELSPEFYDVQESVLSRDAGLWSTPVLSRFVLRLLGRSRQEEENTDAMIPLPSGDIPFIR
ncbi:MAG TPA: hypothetical protein VEF05_16650 [Terriglobales bacterium]|nr:hypothetical protein [Terriglobales bacterium]